MKVVLFCGGLGMRLRDYAENIPKPMVPIGQRPILWHLMKYYAHFGHKEFILCLGHRGEVIKDFFLNYEECISNDFVLSQGGKERELLSRDLDDWRITFVDTGKSASIGERLLAVRDYLGGDEEFLANYSDGLTAMHLPTQIEHFRKKGKVASFISVTPNMSYHFVTTNRSGEVTSIRDFAQSGIRVNGGFFVFRREIFNYIRPGEDLVAEPFQRLIAEGELLAYEFDGFWRPMDTAKDKKGLDDLNDAGHPPWEVWNGTDERSQDPATDSDDATPALRLGPH